LRAPEAAKKQAANLYKKIVPVYEYYGFTPPSAGVIARDLSEKIEKAIIQHCESFTKGTFPSLTFSYVSFCFSLFYFSLLLVFATFPY